MSAVLITIIVVLLGVICFLIVQISKAKFHHKIKIMQLDDLILQLVLEQKSQSLHLKLSEELKSKLLDARISLDENILELQKNLFEEVALNT